MEGRPFASRRSFVSTVPPARPTGPPHRPAQPFGRSIIPDKRIGRFRQPYRGLADPVGALATLKSGQIGPQPGHNLRTKGRL